VSWTYTNYPLAYLLAGIGLAGLVLGLLTLYASPNTWLGRLPIGVAYTMAGIGTLACLVSLAVAP
jgi:hypothetical protein